MMIFYFIQLRQIFKQKIRSDIAVLINYLLRFDLAKWNKVQQDFRNI